ncbi:hypothetical protein MGG_10048 [Pyricularia oryzae 70-15]|uniref:Uncharacterized protein n=1 Tax=Pyricularia oryzae (strain 70-15 / ATCC MYA-4617 / FGSC 8958) TaxID=242507 RepID=G4N998_PYRO7|nr:uncharacterized protein MGG_10048 [Pyricularia oryzae 70-15]EHA51139.1 hypothetical protein MGG_10048 [Pyricularia oryzae 70-15]KAI7914739.1 hypothetical protein M9X92_008854 [Pyricularia oryzae]KAI7915263.1 hypothetical protein M0657_009152 [Pyricularia oryzae]
MSINTGVHLRDLVPEPAITHPDANQHQASSMREVPSDSHALAVSDPGENKGAAQVGHSQEQLVDLGWQSDPKEIPDNLIAGIDNEDLWTFVRRFDKQVFFLKETSDALVGGLDLYLADGAEFSANKLRSQFERLYMGMIVGLIASIKHVARLRSWREPRRTGAFCAAYLTAWALNMLYPLLFASLITLIVSERARSLAFPPAPVSLVDRHTGGPTKPEAGVLGSIESATGAPEHSKGEAVENEASNFVTGVAGIAVNTLTAQDPKSQPDNEEGEKHITDDMPEPDEAATAIASAKDKAAGVPKPSQDKTKQPMETLMWSKMRPLLHMMTLTSDTYERFANALSPSPPFHPYLHRLRLASTVAPLFLASLFMSAHTVNKIVSFAFGFVFFGDPVITPMTNWLDWAYPNWRKVLHINNTLLKGVPTNAQVAITLLRHAEANRCPLPPPPQITGPPPKEPIDLDDPHVIEAAPGGDQPLAASDRDLDDAAERDDEKLDRAGGEDPELTSTQNKHSGKASKLLGLLRGGTKAGVKAGLVVNKARSKIGTNKESAKNRLGAVPDKEEGRNKHSEGGPVRFSGRWQGKEGFICVAWQGGEPVVSFSDIKTATAARRAAGEDPDGPGSNDADLMQMDPAWTVAVGQITELKKHAGFGVKSKLAIGWALERDINDGLEIIDRSGESKVLTAVPKRDELFNRLCAMGGQKWELW